MARKKTPEVPVPAEQDETSNLLQVLRRLTTQVEGLVQQVGALTDRAAVLTEAIDDVRMEIEISWPYYLHFLHLLTDRRIAAHAAAGSSGSEKVIGSAVLASWSSTK